MRMVAEIVTGAVNAGHAPAFFESAIICTPRAEDIEVSSARPTGSNFA